VRVLPSYLTPPLPTTTTTTTTTASPRAHTTPGALRFGYSYGGDGEAISRLDLRNLAGFVRDKAALITNWLLPVPSLHLELRQEWPVVEEHRALLPILL
jgi:hypothetical protein